MKELDMACEKFSQLLQEQMQRINCMNTEKTDFSKKGKITIGVAAGDGIGPIIVEQAMRILQALLSEKIKAGKIQIKIIEGLTIENRMHQGKSVPEDVLEEIKCCDVLLKGPTTTPMGGKMESAQCNASQRIGFVRQSEACQCSERRNRLGVFQGKHRGRIRVGKPWCFLAGNGYRL